MVGWMSHSEEPVRAFGHLHVPRHVTHSGLAEESGLAHKDLDLLLAAF